MTTGSASKAVIRDGVFRRGMGSHRAEEARAQEARDNMSAIVPKRGATRRAGNEPKAPKRAFLHASSGNRRSITVGTSAVVREFPWGMLARASETTTCIDQAQGTQTTIRAHSRRSMHSAPSARVVCRNAHSGCRCGRVQPGWPGRSSRLIGHGRANAVNAQPRHCRAVAQVLFVKRPSQKACGLPLCGQQRDRLLVKGHKGCPAEPAPLIGTHTIRKIAARLKHRQTGFDGRPVHLHLHNCQSGADRGRHVSGLKAVDPAEHPHELAETWHGDRDQCGIAQPCIGRWPGTVLSKKPA